MTRWFLLGVTVLFTVGYLGLSERTLAYRQIGNFSPTVPASLPPPSLNTPNEQVVMGIVRHVEPGKGIVILETRTDVLVVRAPTEVCQKLHEGDVIMATLTPEEDKIPV